MSRTINICAFAILLLVGIRENTNYNKRYFKTKKMYFKKQKN